VTKKENSVLLKLVEKVSKHEESLFNLDTNIARLLEQFDDFRDCMREDISKLQKNMSALLQWRNDFEKAQDRKIQWLSVSVATFTAVFTILFSFILFV